MGAKMRRITLLFAAPLSDEINVHVGRLAGGSSLAGQRSDEEDAADSRPHSSVTFRHHFRDM